MKRPDDIIGIATLAAIFSVIAWMAAMLTRTPEDECIIGYIYLTGYLQPLVWVNAAFALFTALLIAIQIRRTGWKSTFSTAWGVGSLILAVPGLYFAVLVLLTLCELFPAFAKH